MEVLCDSSGGCREYMEAGVPSEAPEFGEDLASNFQEESGDEHADGWDTWLDDDL